MAAPRALASSADMDILIGPTRNDTAKFSIPTYSLVDVMKSAPLLLKETSRDSILSKRFASNVLRFNFILISLKNDAAEFHCRTEFAAWNVKTFIFPVLLVCPRDIVGRDATRYFAVVFVGKFHKIGKCAHFISLDFYTASRPGIHACPGPSAAVARPTRRWSGGSSAGASQAPAWRQGPAGPAHALGLSTLGLQLVPLGDLQGRHARAGSVDSVRLVPGVAQRIALADVVTEDGHDAATKGRVSGFTRQGVCCAHDGLLVAGGLFLLGRIANFRPQDVQA